MTDTDLESMQAAEERQPVDALGYVASIVDRRQQTVARQRRRRIRTVGVAFVTTAALVGMFAVGRTTAEPPPPARVITPDMVNEPYDNTPEGLISTLTLPANNDPAVTQYLCTNIKQLTELAAIPLVELDALQAETAGAIYTHLVAISDTEQAAVYLAPATLMQTLIDTQSFGDPARIGVIADSDTGRDAVSSYAVITATASRQC